MPEYSLSLLILVSLVFMMIVQAMIASIAHRKQKTYIPGVVDAALDHHSFVFRSHRTFMNSLENTPIFILSALLAIYASVAPMTLAWTVGVYFFGRLVHMVLFYAVATNKNPSPRSYFFMISLFAQIYLTIVTFVALI